MRDDLRAARAQWCAAKAAGFLIGSAALRVVGLRAFDGGVSGHNAGEGMRGGQFDYIVDGFVGEVGRNLDKERSLGIDRAQGFQNFVQGTSVL